MTSTGQRFVISWLLNNYKFLEGFKRKPLYFTGLKTMIKNELVSWTAVISQLVLEKLVKIRYATPILYLLYWPRLWSVFHLKWSSIRWNKVHRRWSSAWQVRKNSVVLFWFLLVSLNKTLSVYTLPRRSLKSIKKHQMYAFLTNF